VTRVRRILGTAAACAAVAEAEHEIEQLARDAREIAGGE
jgi:hypothetical protein